MRQCMFMFIYEQHHYVDALIDIIKENKKQQ